MGGGTGDVWRCVFVWHYCVCAACGVQTDCLWETAKVCAHFLQRKLLQERCNLRFRTPPRTPMHTMRIVWLVVVAAVLLPASTAAHARASLRTRGDPTQVANFADTIASIQKLHPTAKRVIYNIGSFSDPPAPFDNETLVVAVDPNPDTTAAIAAVPNRYVVTAAISKAWGLAAFYHYAESSSLLPPNTAHKQDFAAKWTEQWMQKGHHGRPSLVVTLPLSALMEAFGHLQCWYLKIDAQGVDLAVAQSAGDHIRKCPFVTAETNCAGFQTYEKAENDFVKHWLPYMTSVGFEPINKCSASDAAVEMNIYWRNKHVHGPTFDDVKRLCPVCVS